MGKIIHLTCFFFYQVFVSKTLQTHGTADGKEETIISLYHFHLITNIQTLFVFLHVRWLPRIFNRMACNYQTAIQWDLPPWGITIWLIDNGMSITIYLVMLFYNQWQKLWDWHSLPPYSMLVTSLLAHFWPVLPGTAFLGLIQDLVRGREVLGIFELVKYFLELLWKYSEYQ